MLFGTNISEPEDEPEEEFCSVGIMVSTSGFQPEDTSSILVPNT
jgi:hypothetical protein